MAPPRTLSVIIPVWQEARLIADAVTWAKAIGDEVIVVDGGSPDGTGKEAEKAGAIVLQAEKGRGPQLRAGAARATGEVLLFLHADVRLAASARDAIFDALADPKVPGGGFYIRFLPASWFTRVIEPGNSLRRRITRRYYGDTGIFCRAEVYRALHGHRPWAVMHDYEFSSRLEGRGRGAYIEEPCVWASARRFRGRELRTFLTWLTVQTLYRFGVSPYRLSRLYPDVRDTAEGDRAFMDEAARTIRGSPS